MGCEALVKGVRRCKRRELGRHRSSSPFRVEGGAGCARMWRQLALGRGGG